MQRLGLIRYQLTLALQQAGQEHPLNGFSLLGFQDTIESFLHLAAGHLRIDVKGKEFMNYVDGVNEKMPGGQGLGYRTQLLALNHARVNLKHHGNLPDQGTIERHRAMTIAFLDEATRRLFGIAFDSVSLAYLISDQQVRQHVRGAEHAWQAGDVPEAMTELRRSLDQLLKLPRRRAAKPSSGLPSVLVSKDTRRLGIHGIIKWLEGLDQAMTALDHRLALLSLGIDLYRYDFFLAYTPSIIHTLSGEPDIYHKEVAVDQAVFDSCRQFVIDVALQRESRNENIQPLSEP
jgi:hypothetical protein